MLTKRIIPCLDIKDGKVVKGINFNDLETIGDPVLLAVKYYEGGADELCLLDITASAERRKTSLDIISAIAKNIFIPFTVGGGIKSIDDIEKLLKAGADKAAFCTQAVLNPGIIKEASQRFGSQAIVISIDVKKNNGTWEAYIYGGSKNTGINALDLAKKCESLGAGEILLNSIDMDGKSDGYDIEITKKISESVSIPVIASSGAGSPRQIMEAFSKGKADAALAASILHYGKYKISEIKDYLKKNGVDVR